MSVINKMLQDLDQRRGRPGGEAASGEAIRSVVPAAAGRRRQTALLGTLGLVLAGVAAAWWLGWLQPRSVPVQVAAVAPPAVAPIAPPKVQPAAIAPAAVVMPVPTPTPTPAASAVDVVPSPAAVAPKAEVRRPDAVASAVFSSAVIAPAASTPGAARPNALRTAVAPAPALTVAGNSVAPAPAKAATPVPKAAEGKSYTPEQLSTNLLAEAIRLDQQGRPEDAKIPLQKLLSANPLNVRARQMLAQMQLDTGNADQARSLLAEGQRLLPEQSNFTMTLARLQVDGGDVGGAIRMLEADRSAARNDPQVNAFLAALLLRVERHDEAVQRYLVALRSDPANPTWLVGVGVAFEGAGKPIDAAEAYRRAEGSPNLPAETAEFLSSRLAKLRR